MNSKTEKNNLKIKTKLVGLKKIVLPRKAWLATLLSLAGLTFLSFAGLLWSYTASAQEEVHNTTYYCMQEAAFDYRVHLMPNALFDQSVLGPGRGYITELAEYIVVDFEYNFFGEEEAEITGTYEVIATLAAYTRDQEHMVWDKNYSLLPEEKFSVTESDFLIKENIEIPFAKYLSFIEQVREETGYNPAELNLLVRGNVNVEVVTDEGVFIEELSPMMIIPMNEKSFYVSGELVDDKENRITETNTLAVAPVNNARAVAPFITSVLAVVLILFRVLTVPAKGKEKKQQLEVSGILKKHKDRIVVTANGVTSVPSGAITVYSFEELVKLADEVGKPILYPKPGMDSKGDHFFLIYTSEQVFAYGLNNSAGLENNDD